MNADRLGLLELFFIFGIALALAIAELISLRLKMRRPGESKRADKPSDPPGYNRRRSPR